MKNYEAELKEENFHASLPGFVCKVSIYENLTAKTYQDCVEKKLQNLNCQRVKMKHFKVY